jgi:uncharacterized protein (TIGR02594 family)
MERLPRSPYTFLLSRTGLTPMMYRALNLYGICELKGLENNPVIIGWAQEVANTDDVGKWFAEFYDADSIPWCGLFVAICAVRSGRPAFNKCLAAREWLNWGEAVELEDVGVGDVVVFSRGDPAGKSGHVGFYVGETSDKKYIHVLGGNQSDSVSIVKIDASRLLGVRRWPGDKPLLKRRFIDGGDESEGEA